MLRRAVARVAGVELPAPFGVIAFVGVISVLGFGLIAPVIPLLIQRLSLSNAAGGGLLAAFAAGRMITTLPSGMVTDRFGLRLVALAVCSFSTVASLIAAIMIESYLVLLAAQFTMGMGSAVLMTAALTAVMGIVPEAGVGRAVSAYQGVVVGMMLLAPTFGGVAASVLGPSGPFWFTAAASAIGVGLSLFGLSPDILVGDSRRSLPAVARRERRQNLTRLFRSRPFVLSSLAAFAMVWSISGVRNTLIPIYADTQFGLDPATIGALLTLAALGAVLMLPLAGRAADRFGRRPLIRIGTMGLAVGAIGLGGTTILWVVIIVAFAVELSRGLLVPTQVTIMADISTGETRATVVGVSRMGNSIGAATGPAVAGLLTDIMGARGAFFGAGAVLAVIAVLCAGIPETRPSPQEEDEDGTPEVTDGVCAPAQRCPDADSTDARAPAKPRT